MDDIGALASLIGASIAIWQAYAAKTAAKQAKEARAQIIDHRKTSEVTKLQLSCDTAQSSMEKYGPSSSPDSIRIYLTGTTPNRDADAVQSFMLLLKEHRLMFGFKNPNVADESVESIKKILVFFSKSYDSPEKLKEHGTELLMKINDMSSTIKKHYDDKKEVKKK
ncbi:MAG: hypothetical protein JKY23_07245 [Nitrospinaceae bacterium]|nr:hypothetical protein [Nitrospinaceae bacterium]